MVSRFSGGREGQRKSLLLTAPHVIELHAFNILLAATCHTKHLYFKLVQQPNFLKANHTTEISDPFRVDPPKTKTTTLTS